MKSLWKTILDGLTYQDLAGRRQPRAFTVLTLLILAVLLLAAGQAWLNHFLLMRQVRATAELVSIPVTSPDLQPIVLQQAPTTVTPASCPTDPASWSLSDVVISQNYKTIQPACVYEGLARTVAWALAAREGYSRSEATTRLGFTSMPMRQLDRVTVLTDTQGPTDVPVAFIPPHPSFAEWHVDDQGRPAVIYGLRGCFRTSSVTGNRVAVWGGEYPVICVVAEDSHATHVVYGLDGHQYTSPATPMRSFLLFGYVADGRWAWLGTRADPQLPITDIEKSSRELMTVAALFDAQPWDAQWLSNLYDMEMQALPGNWINLNDEAEKQAILDGLNVQMSGGNP